MATGSVRNSRRFGELAAVLKERLQGHDVSLVGGEAEELLGAHVSAVAAQLRVTERTVLTTYMSEDAVTALAERFAEQKAEYHEATEAAEPVMLDVAGAGHVLAALGMAVKLAVVHADETRTASLAVMTDAADGIVSIGAGLRTAGPGDRIGFGGHVLVLARGILVDTIGYLRSGRWRCACGPHPDGAECGVAAGHGSRPVPDRRLAARRRFRAVVTVSDLSGRRPGRTGAAGARAALVKQAGRRLSDRLTVSGNQELDPGTRTRTSLVRGQRFQGERGFALLGQRWPLLQHATASPRSITQTVRAALVLTQFEHKYIG